MGTVRPQSAAATSLGLAASCDYHVCFWAASLSLFLKAGKRTRLAFKEKTPHATPMPALRQLMADVSLGRIPSGAKQRV